MKRKSNIVRVAIILAILVSGLTLAASPGAALTGIPAGTHIDEATLWVFVGNASGQTVNVHQVTEDWTEMGVTWNSFNGDYAPAITGSFLGTPGWKSADVTALVQAWVDGAVPNYGVLLEQGQSNYTVFWSRENSSGDGPRLVVKYGEVEVTFPAAADAYIRELNDPDTNYGGEQVLYTGLIAGSEKQALIRFDIPTVPAGCTLTPGYWKTHSEYGPAPYDATWAMLPNGADTPFFTSGQSYYEVLWTEPQGGNAYYILAHAYIAAELNFLNGADPTAAQAAFDAATDLFMMYDDSIPKNDPNRAIAIGLAETLDNYNNGIIGPGHCYE